MNTSASHKTIIIRWEGPVTMDSLKRGTGGGLYLLSGLCKYERKDSIQYCGITERDFPDRFAQHHKVSLIRRNLRCWTGTVIYPKRASRTTLETAESCLIYFAQPPLNDRKTVNPPKATTVISHWFKPNGEPRYNQQGLLSHFPDVVSWDGSHWREGNLRAWEE